MGSGGCGRGSQVAAWLEAAAGCQRLRSLQPKVHRRFELHLKQRRRQSDEQLRQRDLPSWFACNRT